MTSQIRVGVPISRGSRTIARWIGNARGWLPSSAPSSSQHAASRRRRRPLPSARRTGIARGHARAVAAAARRLVAAPSPCTRPTRRQRRTTTARSAPRRSGRNARRWAAVPPSTRASPWRSFGVAPGAVSRRCRRPAPSSTGPTGPVTLARRRCQGFATRTRTASRASRSRPTRLILASTTNECPSLPSVARLPES